MPRKTSWLAAVLLLILSGWSPAPLPAQPALAGSEISLSPPGGDPPSDVALAADRRGGLTAVWQVGTRVFARRYDPQGQPATAVLALGEASGLDAAALQSGFAVAGLFTSGTYPLRLGQLYDDAGRPMGSPFLLETPESSPLAVAPRMVADQEGHLVVAWVGTDAGTGSPEIFLRRFTPAGEPLGPPQRMARPGGAGIAYLDLAQSAGGRLLVTWLEQGVYQVFGQLLDPAGAALAPPFQVSEGKSFYPPAGAFTQNGGLFFAWHGARANPPSPFASQTGILIRAYDSAGRPASEVTALEVEGHPTSAPVIASDSRQRLFVSWLGGVAGLQLLEAGGVPPTPALGNRPYQAFGTPHAIAAWDNGSVAVAARRLSPDSTQYRGLTLQRFATRASAGLLRFEAERLAAAEGDGPVTVRVERREGSAGTVSADYTVRRADAPAGEVLAAGTVTFWGGVSNPQNITVPVDDDPVPAGRETLVVTLSNPTGGAALGSPAEAYVAIRDDDTPSPLLQNAGPLLEMGGANPFLLESAGNPTVAALAQGGFAAFWTLHRHHAFVPTLFSRLYDAADTAVSQQLTAGSLANAYLATAHPAGGLTVVGNYFGSGLEPLGVLGERFDAAGRRRAGPYPLPEMPAAIAAGPAGGLFALTRQASGGRLSLSRLGPHGHPLGTPAAVAPEPACAVSSPLLASDAAGRAVVVWQDPSCTRIFVRRFSAAGKPLGAAVEVDPQTDRRPGRMAVAAAPDGRFVVVWEAEGDGDGRGLFLRRFGTSDRPRPRWVVLPVNSHRQGDQLLPGVAVQGDGRFLVAWQSPGEGGPKIVGQYFGDDGQPAGSDFSLDSRIPTAETGVAVAATPAGGYVAVWKALGPDTIFARRLAP